MKRFGSPATLALVVSAAAVLLLLWAPWRGTRIAAPAGGLAAQPKSSPAPSASDLSEAATRPPAPSTVPAREAPRRPLAVAKESPLHAWTAEDARSPEVIHKIAHNEWEERRLIEENPRITGRQLVYRKEPVFIAVERARASGESLRTLTLPGFDGRELEVQVEKADLEPSGLSGTLTGRLPGLGESLVTLAFKQGTEAFTVVSPEDGVYLQGHPREPGEIMVSSFVPGTYLSVRGGEPIRTNEQFKPAE